MLDFGVAKLGPQGADAASFQTHQGAIIGTPSYMSPEQAGAKTLDARSDLYSLGCLAYACLTGSPPFSGQITEVLVSHLQEAPRPPSEVVSEGVGNGANDLLLKLLAKSPDDRPADAVTVRAHIEALLSLPAEERDEGETTRGEQSPMVHEDREPRATRHRGSRWTLAVIGAIIVALLTTLGVVSALDRRERTNDEQTLTGPPAGFLEIPRNHKR